RAETTTVEPDANRSTGRYPVIGTVGFLGWRRLRAPRPCGMMERTSSPLPLGVTVILEIRTYRLKPGTTEEFVRLMREESMPLLEKFGIRVVRYGASLAAEDGNEEAYLIRAFTSLEAHREQEE